MLFCSNSRRQESIYINSNGMTSREITRLNRKIARRRWSPGPLGYLTVLTILLGIIITILLFRLL